MTTKEKLIEYLKKEIYDTKYLELAQEFVKKCAGKKITKRLDKYVPEGMYLRKNITYSGNYYIIRAKIDGNDYGNYFRLDNVVPTLEEFMAEIHTPYIILKKNKEINDILNNDEALQSMADALDNFGEAVKKVKDISNKDFSGVSLSEFYKELGYTVRFSNGHLF